MKKKGKKITKKNQLKEAFNEKYIQVAFWEATDWTVHIIIVAFWTALSFAEKRAVVDDVRMAKIWVVSSLYPLMSLLATDKLSCIFVNKDSIIILTLFLFNG